MNKDAIHTVRDDDLLLAVAADIHRNGVEIMNVPTKTVACVRCSKELVVMRIYIDATWECGECIGVIRETT